MANIVHVATWQFVENTTGSVVKSRKSSDGLANFGFNNDVGSTKME